MAVPAVPQARLTMIEAEIFPGALEAFLDRPAQTCDACQFGQRRSGRREGQVIGAALEVAPVAADQEAAL